MPRNASKAKGDQAERAVAAIISDLLGLTVKRLLGAGRAEDVGDIGVPDTAVQVKHYPKTGLAAAVADCVKDLERNQANAGTTFAVGFARGRGGQWVAVMTPAQWATYHREATKED
jgi:hypothetical protein